MARGDTERVFQAMAAADGIPLIRARVPWINQRGHFGLPPQAASVFETLDRVFDALHGIQPEQAAKRLIPLPGDFLHVASRTFIEVDEHQHFTTHRLTTLNYYPQGLDVGFDIDEYRSLCRTWSPKADRYRPHKAAPGFGEGGRQRQRAYNDALRDLATPAMGHPGVVRVAAPERDGEAAYLRVRDRLSSLRS